MKKLGVESLDNLTDEQMYALGTEIPNMSDEVRKKLIDTVPGLQKFLEEAMNAAEQVSSRSIDARGEEAKLVHEAYADGRRILKGELSRDDLSEERRAYLIDEALKTADKQAEFARANSAAGERTAQAVANTGTRYALIGALTVFALAGGKAVFSRLR
ncbi:hypothetical protein ACEYYH_14400 [Microbacterium trichothecenolyticum]|uniref:hypothetical protein n=1 Tax=Microbacterium trichothecenolyticum TaxID=69370 RepID=UPI0035BE2591